MEGKDQNKDSERGKKELIKEKITGRRLTPIRIFKMIITAAFCGFAFALAGIITIHFVGPYVYDIDAQGESLNAANKSNLVPADVNTEEDALSGDGLTGNGEDAITSEDDADGPFTQASKGTPSVTLEETETSPQDEDQTESTAEPSDPANEISQESTASLTGITDQTSGQDETEILAQTLSAKRQQDVENISKFMVTIEGSSNHTTWFETRTSSIEENSGMIIDVNDEEILILTTAQAVDFESIRVLFFNGYSSDAYVKQISKHDSLAVIAVSKINEGDGNVSANETEAENSSSSTDESVSDTSGEIISQLSDIEAVEFAEAEEIYLARSVIAAGAPLGEPGSFAFGDIGYINKNVSGLDTVQDVFYVSISVNTSRGTFIMSEDGKFLGMATEEITDSDSTATGVVSAVISAVSLEDTVDRLKSGEEIAFIGVSGVKVSTDMYRDGIPRGVYVTGVELSGPAYAAGVMRGDIITLIDTHEIRDMSGLTSIIHQTLPGAEITITVMRSTANQNFEELKFTCTVAER